MAVRTSTARSAMSRTRLPPASASPLCARIVTGPRAAQRIRTQATKTARAATRACRTTPGRAARTAPNVISRRGMPLLTTRPAPPVTSPTAEPSSKRASRVMRRSTRRRPVVTLRAPLVTIPMVRTRASPRASARTAIAPRPTGTRTRPSLRAVPPATGPTAAPPASSRLALLSRRPAPAATSPARCPGSTPSKVIPPAPRVTLPTTARLVATEHRARRVTRNKSIIRPVRRTARPATCSAAASRGGRGAHGQAVVGSKQGAPTNR
jgi:hypothetical protein